MDDAIFQTNLLFMPKYIYAKTAAQLLGKTEHMFKLLITEDKEFPKSYKRGSRNMYKYSEIIEYARKG